MHKLILSLLPVALLACEPVPYPECRRFLAEEPALEIGTGIEAYEPLPDELGYEFGPQGGWHVWGSLRAEGVWPGIEGTPNETTPVVSFTLQAVEGDLTGGYQRLRRPMTLQAGDVAELVGEQVILDVSDPSEADGVEVDLTATVEDACGTVVTRTERVVLRDGLL